MSLKAIVHKALQDVADQIYARVPQPLPHGNAFKNAKLIAHRGAHDGRKVPENSIAAFQRAADAGLWGIEFDVRWTRDDVPAIHHDPSADRVWGIPLTIAQTDYHTLHTQLPQIPTLKEIVERFGKKVHLMIEIKKTTSPFTDRQKDVLKNLLVPLTPVHDYHVMAIHPEIFDAFDFVPREACLPIAEINAQNLSRNIVDKGYAGLTGHYVLLNRQIQKRLKSRGLKIGTGFIASEACLFRELNREVEWLYTNDAVKIQSLINVRRPSE